MPELFTHESLTRESFTPESPAPTSPASAWFVYMILGSDRQLYTGITTAMLRRWQEHSSGKSGARYFRGRKPAVLCFLEPHPDRSQASKREYRIKQLTRAHKWQLIKTHLNTSRETMEQCHLEMIPTATLQLLIEDTAQ